MFKLLMTMDIVNDFCAICNKYDFDVNVLDGRRICIDGKSLVGVTELCGKVVDVSPVVLGDSMEDNLKIANFFADIKKLGAYKEAY